MNTGKIVAGGRVEIEGSTRGPRGPKKHPVSLELTLIRHENGCKLLLDVALPIENVNFRLGIQNCF